MRVFLDHWFTTAFMSVLTVYALFADDIRMLSSDKVSLIMI